MADETPDSDFPDPKGMQKWLEDEIRDIMKAAELRTRDAARFVGRYSSGEISREEAAQLSYEYANRWGDDALRGVFHSKGMTDEEILARIDEARSPDFVERLLRKRHENPDKKRQ